MIGAIIGDIVGSAYELDNIKTKDFELFEGNCRFTDDTVLTLAIAKAIRDCEGHYSNLKEKTVEYMREFAKKYKNAGFSKDFMKWVKSDNPEPYNSCGNGAAMRISSVGLISTTVEQVKDLSYKVTSVTHNHIEGIKGAESVATAIFLAANGLSKEGIEEYINQNYYKIDFTVEDLMQSYGTYYDCQNTVPQAMQCFFESTSFEDAIKNAVAIGGDSDTIACITGSIAEAYYGVTRDLRMKGLSYLDDNLKTIFKDVENYITAINRQGELD